MVVCERRRHDAVEQQARAARSRTRRANRAAARRCWRRDGAAGRAPSASSVAARGLEARALLVEQRVLGLVGGGEVRVHRLELEVRARQQLRQRPRAGCRGGTRGGSCRCRSSGGSAACVARAAAAACSARPAAGLEMVGVRSCSNTPSRSLTLSAPKIRIGARDARLAQLDAFLDVGHRQQRRAGLLERRAPRARAPCP